MCLFDVTVCVCLESPLSWVATLPIAECLLCDATTKDNVLYTKWMMNVIACLSLQKLLVLSSHECSLFNKTTDWSIVTWSHSYGLYQSIQNIHTSLTPHIKDYSSNLHLKMQRFASSYHLDLFITGDKHVFVAWRWICVSLIWRLAELGANRFYKRVDVDQEDWTAIEGWMRAVVEATFTMELNTTVDYLDLTGLGGEGSGHSRTKPFMAQVTVSSKKETTWWLLENGQSLCRFQTSSAHFIESKMVCVYVCVCVRERER